MPKVTVQRTYLQQLAATHASVSPEALPPGVSITEESPCGVGTYCQLYRDVGGRHHWIDRLQWSHDVLAAHLARDTVRVWILRDQEGAGGFFELAQHSDRSVEIAYFGLLPSRIGRGLGRQLLERAVREGWSWGATRLWLHTCTLDANAALPNYLARGFVPYHVESYETGTPDH